MAPKLSRLAARTMPSAGHGYLTVLGYSAARLRARLTKRYEINATVTEPRPSGSGFRQESPKRLSTRPGGLSHRGAEGRTICYDSEFGTQWLRMASNMLRRACRSVILRKYPLIRM